MDLGSSPYDPPICETLNKLLPVPEPPFSHLENGRGTDHISLGCCRDQMSQCVELLSQAWPPFSLLGGLLAHSGGGQPGPVPLLPQGSQGGLVPPPVQARMPASMCLAHGPAGPAGLLRWLWMSRSSVMESAGPEAWLMSRCPLGSPGIQAPLHCVSQEPGGDALGPKWECPIPTAWPGALTISVPFSPTLPCPCKEAYSPLSMVACKGPPNLSLTSA